MTKQASDAPATDWAAVRRAYVNDGVAVREICRIHAIQAQTLYRRARQEGWPRRRPSEGDGSEDASLRLLARLRRIAEDQIAEVEARRATRAGATPSGEPERDARILNELVKLIERIAAIEAKHQVRRDGSLEGSQTDRAQRRADLADKLIAMLEQDRGAPLRDEPGG